MRSHFLLLDVDKDGVVDFEVLEEDDVEVLAAGIAGVDFADLMRGEEPVPAVPEGDDREVDEQEYAYPHPETSYVRLCIHFRFLVVLFLSRFLYQGEDLGYGVGGLRREDVAIKGIPREVGSWRSRIGGVGTDGEEGEETSRQGCAEKGIVATAAGTPFLEVGVMSRYQGTDMVEGLTVAGGLGVDDFFNFLFCLHIFLCFLPFSI